MSIFVQILVGQVDLDHLIELGFNDTSTLVGHFFLSSPREREKRDSRGDKRGTGKRNRNESEENVFD